MSERFAKPTLRDLLRVVRERRLLIFVTVLVFGGVVTLFEGLSKRTYAGYADVQITNRSPESHFFGSRLPRQASDLAKGLSRDARRAYRVEVVSDARRRMGAVPNGYVLTGTFQADALPFAGRVRITALDEDARLAGRAAGALAAALAADLRREDRRQFDAAIREVRAQRAPLIERRYERNTDDALKLIDRREAEREIARLRVLRSVSQSARVVGKPVVPRDPFYSPGDRGRSLLNLGLSLGLLLAFFLDRTDGRPRQASRLAAAGGVSLLGAIPRQARFWRRGARRRLEDLAADRLRAAVEAGRSGRVLLTSAEPSDARARVAVLLARAGARAGRRVCLVEADLRRPSLAPALGAEPAGPGFAEALDGGDPVALAVDTGPDGPALLRRGNGTAVIDRLADVATARVLDRLAEHYDLVLVEAPPVLVAADAAELGGAVDTILLCARSGRTRAADLEGAAAALAAIERPALGVAVLDVDSRDPAVRALRAPGAPADATAGARVAGEAATV